MESLYENTVLERMLLAFDLAQTAEELTRARLSRENPAASPEELESLFVEWLHRRPGAELGDAVGRVRRASKAL